MKIMATLYRLTDSRITWRSDAHFTPARSVVVGVLVAVTDLELQFIPAEEAPDGPVVCDTGDGGEGQEFPSIPAYATFLMQHDWMPHDRQCPPHWVFMRARPRPDVSTAFVSDDGLVRLPPRILHALGLESGGGINFLINKQSGHVELLSDPQVDALFDQPSEATDSAPAEGDDSL
jgi:hypothetical protein